MMMLCWWPGTRIRFMNIGTSSRPQMSAHCSVWKTHTAANWKNFVNNKNSWKVKVSSVSMQFKHPPDRSHDQWRGCRTCLQWVRFNKRSAVLVTVTPSTPHSARCPRMHPPVTLSTSSFSIQLTLIFPVVPHSLTKTSRKISTNMVPNLALLPSNMWYIVVTPAAAWTVVCPPPHLQPPLSSHHLYPAPKPRHLTGGNTVQYCNYRWKRRYPKIRSAASPSIMICASASQFHIHLQWLNLCLA